MKTIDGQVLKQMFISGANHLYNNYPEIDALNVFPVPDGDTGMNMNLTLTSGAKEIQNRNDTNIFEIAKAFSRGLLMGARGNSGVITSQIFRGFAQGLEGKEEADVDDFAFAMKKGVEVAYKAVQKPVEGTILTVVRESTEYLAERIDDLNSIEKVIDTLIQGARESLKRTPDLLPILKEVGVIDSGGAGLIKILEGMKFALTGEIIERKAISAGANPISAAGALMEDEEFGYCTEFIMSLGPDSVKKPFNEKRFTMVLGSRGNSLVVVHDEDIVKVHVHTLKPGDVLNYAQQFGEFLKLKIENMTEQHHALETGAQVEVHTDLVEEPVHTEPKKQYALIGVSSREGIDELFNEAGIDVIVKGGQTMNPSSEDFVAAIKKANAETVYIMPNNSNIVMAASQACDIVEGVTAYVIPTKTIPQGVAAALNFNPEESEEENFRNMKGALKNVVSGEVTFAIRDSEIGGVKMKKDDFMGILEKDIIVANADLLECTKALLEQMINEESSIVTILVGKDVNEEQKEAIKAYMEENHDDLDLDLRDGGQPVYNFIIGVE